VKQDFNNDLDSYISRRRADRKPFEKTMQILKEKVKKSKEPYDEEPKQTGKISMMFRKRIPTEEEVMHQKKTEKKEIEELEEEDEVIAEEMEELDKKPGFFSKLFGKGKQDEFEEEEVEQVDPEIETLKDTIKILHSWLEKLPPEQVQKFRNSPDYEKYKEALRKLKLIKE
jgi:hypothetical protein